MCIFVSKYFRKISRSFQGEIFKESLLKQPHVNLQLLKICKLSKQINFENFQKFLRSSRIGINLKIAASAPNDFQYIFRNFLRFFPSGRKSRANERIGSQSLYTLVFIRIGNYIRKFRAYMLNKIQRNFMIHAVYTKSSLQFMKHIRKS